MKTPSSVITSLSACLLLAGLVSASAPWYDRALTGIETGPTGAHFGHSNAGDARFAAKFDGAEIVRRAVAAHSEYLVMWVRHGDYAYYDSKRVRKRGQEKIHDKWGVDGVA